VEGRAYEFGSRLGFVCAPMIWAFVAALIIYFFTGAVLKNKRPEWFRTEQRKWLIILILWLICLVPAVARVIIHGSIC